METPAQNFRQWMEDNRISNDDARKRFGITQQTLYNWRSSGVPITKQAHVNYIIACWEKPTAAELGTTLLLKPSSIQFNAWNQAWRHSPYSTLEQWAISGLDELAESEAQETTLKVAEDPTPYGHSNGKTGNG
jgi:hypothetical protein